MKVILSLLSLFLGLTVIAVSLSMFITGRFLLIPFLILLLNIAILFYIIRGKDLIIENKVKKAFDNGLEQIFAKYIPIDAYGIKFTESSVAFKLADGQYFWFYFEKIGYANLPNVRYTKAMAKEYKKRFLSNDKNVKIYPVRSEIDYGTISTGYKTTKSYDGYHTVETTETYQTGGEKIGYKLINYNIKRTDIVAKPPKKQW